MRSGVHYFLSVLCLAVTVHGSAAERMVTSSVAEGGISSNPIARLGVEEAFRKALGSIKSAVVLQDTNASFRVSRVEPGRWLIQVREKSDVPAGGLSVMVKDDGAIEFKLAQTNTNAAAWIASAKLGEPDRSVKSRPEAAFRHGIQALVKWYRMTPDSFFALRGRITLSRSGKEQWLMDIAGYSDTPLGGWLLEINDSGEVKNVSIF